MAGQEEYIGKEIGNLGKRLRQIRKERGFTNHEHFAYEHEMTRSQYGRYEKGTDLRFSSLLKVLKAMDISLAEFFAEGFE